nr:putative disease resistance RPP13-like protein 3 [Ipomoea batatas]
MDDLLQVLLQSIEASSLAKGQSAETFELKDKVQVLLQSIEASSPTEGQSTETFELKDKTLIMYTLPKTPLLRQLCILYDSSFHFKDDEENLILENLTTLLWLSDFCCKNEALMVRIPNVKKLGVRYELLKFKDAKHPIDLLHTLSHLKQLENIKFYGTKSLKKIALVPKSYDFPPKLKKLKFSVTMMKLEIMTILGRLPNLQVLQLEKDAFDDSETEWEQVEEGFPKLEVLVFKDQTLCRWIDCSFSFPRLECLVLKSCGSLESLPYECLFGCPCLKLIELESCDYGVLESAKKIQNDGDGLLEIEENGNITCSSTTLKVTLMTPPS